MNKLEEFEQEIKQLPHEHGGLFSDNNTLIERFTNNQENILYPPHHLDYQNKIFTHNHPDTTISHLSIIDIIFFLKNNMKEIRAIHENSSVVSVIKIEDIDMDIKANAINKLRNMWNYVHSKYQSGSSASQYAIQAAQEKFIKDYEDPLGYIFTKHNIPEKTTTKSLIPSFPRRKNYGR